MFIKFTKSDKRKTPVEVLLNHDIKLTSCGAVYTHFGSTDFFTSSFKIETKDKVIYIDPVAVDNPQIADYIFITHAHADHFSIDDILKIINDNTKIVCPKKVAKKLKGYNIIEIKPGDILDLAGVKCEALPAYSIGFPSHPKNSCNVGYILTIQDQRIYHSGDTDFIREIKSIKDISVALVPIDGGNLTMKTTEAIDVINIIQPKIAIPMHYELENNNLELFKSNINDNTEVIILS